MECDWDGHGKRAVEKMHNGLHPTDPVLIRPIIRVKLDEYAKNRHAPGDFLRAVLTNDLREAMSRADVGNLVTLPAIVSYVYNELPHSCWGSEERIDAWLSGSAGD